VAAAAVAPAAAAAPVIVASGFGLGPAAGKAVPVVLQPVVTPPASSKAKTAAVGHLIPLPQPSPKLPSSSPKGKGWDAPLPIWLGQTVEPAGKAKSPLVAAAASPISIVPQDDDWIATPVWDAHAVTSPVADLSWTVPKASAAKAKSPLVAAAAVGVELLSKKDKKTKQERDLLQALRGIQKKDKIIAKYNKLRMDGKRKEAIAYAEHHGMIDEIFDTSQYSIKGDGLSAADASIKSKSSSSKKSSKAGHAVAYAGLSPSEVGFVEITPSSSDVSALSPIIPKQASLSFGQKAEMLEKENLKSNPHDGELSLAWRENLAKLSKRLAGTVSPTFNPQAHGDWM